MPHSCEREPRSRGAHRGASAAPSSASGAITLRDCPCKAQGEMPEQRRIRLLPLLYLSRTTLLALSYHSPTTRTTLVPRSYHSRITLVPLPYYFCTTLVPLSYHSRTTLVPLSYHSRTTLAHSGTTLILLSLRGRPAQRGPDWHSYTPGPREPKVAQVPASPALFSSAKLPSSLDSLRIPLLLLLLLPPPPPRKP